MNRSHIRWNLAAATLALPLLLGSPLACGGGDEGQTSQGALDRELDVALQNRDVEPELQDAPQTEEPAEPPAPERAAPPPPPAPAPAPAPPPPPAPAPAPAVVPPPPPPAPAKVRVTVGAGTTFRVELLDELDTKTSQVGDKFEVRLVDALTEGSTVVAPVGAVIRGRVTALQRGGGGKQPAVLKVAFDEIRLDGRYYPINASVVQANPETRAKQGTGKKAAKIGGGAAAGAILGKVLGGGGKGALIGAAVGAAAGTAITLSADGQDARLAEGSEMTLKLDGPLTVEVTR